MRSLAAHMMMAAVLLAGCAHGDGPGTARPAPADPAGFAQAPMPKIKPKRPASRPAPAAPSSAVTPATAETETPPAAPPSLPAPSLAPEPRPARLNLAELVGMDEPGVRRLLGPPAAVQDVPPARYWQYASASCVLRVFFFMEMTTHSFRALSTELTSNEDAPDADQRCLDHFVAQAPVGRQASTGRGEP